MNTNNIEYNKKKIRKLILDYISSNKGETQKSVAGKIGVALTTLFYKNPTTDTLCKAANFFKCDLNYFFDIPEDILVNYEKKHFASSPDSRYEIMENGEKESMNKKIYELQMHVEMINKELAQLKEMIGILINKNK